MPVPRTKSKPNRSVGTTAEPVNREVLTLAEASAYLRVDEHEVLRIVREQGLPGRKMGESWRFLKSALQDWLRGVPTRKEALLMQVGAFADDPDLETMLKRIHKQRGRQDAEGD